MAPFDRPCTIYNHIQYNIYWSAILNIALSCAVFELFDVECDLENVA